MCRGSTDYAVLAELSRRPSGGDILKICVNAIHAGAPDHWPNCWTVNFAGGVRGGEVIGKSDDISGWTAKPPSCRTRSSPSAPKPWVSTLLPNSPTPRQEIKELFA
jgi:hypothetical protein